MEHATGSDKDLTLGRLARLEVKIADTQSEIRRALELRSRVFRNTLHPSIDADGFDERCDHLIVVDANAGTGHGEDDQADGKVVATYRLIGDRQPNFAGRFYSESAFDVRSLRAAHPDASFLEFGRSCVDPAYRNKRTLELLWHGSWAYVRKYGYDVMFGCASFPGAEPALHQEALALLAQHAPAVEEWEVNVCANVDSKFVPRSLSSKADQGEMRTVLRGLPPLIKGYLRLGAMFSTCAVPDPDFDTTDVLVVLPVSRLSRRYLKYYGENATRHAAA